MEKMNKGAPVMGSRITNYSKRGNRKKETNGMKKLLSIKQKKEGDKN